MGDVKYSRTLIVSSHLLDFLDALDIEVWSDIDDEEHVAPFFLRMRDKNLI